METKTTTTERTLPGDDALLVTMTAGQLRQLIDDAVSAAMDNKAPRYVRGAEALAGVLGCSDETVKAAKRAGRLEGTYVRVGERIIVYDVAKVMDALARQTPPLETSALTDGCYWEETKKAGTRSAGI